MPKTASRELPSPATRRITRVAHGDAGVVVIGASAGGVESLRELLHELPLNFALPVLIVLHRRLTPLTKLSTVMARHCRLPVLDAHEGEQLVGGRVYILPPDQHTAIEPGQRLAFHDHAKINSVRGSADPLFRSAAAIYRDRAIGVVLSGSGRNGAAGAKAIHDAGGLVLAQDPQSTKYPSMPKTAIEAGAVNEVLSPRAIGRRLASLTGHAAGGW